MKILKCSECGNLIEVLENGINPTCCNKQMQDLVANTSEGATEKHLPVIEENTNLAVIKVGEIPHPMEENHYISWIYIKTNNRTIKYNLKPNMEPVVRFHLEESEIVLEAYAYCNLHSLWKTSKN